MRKIFSLAVVSFLALASAAWAQPAYQEMEVQDGATVTGAVLWKGPLPPPRVLYVTKDKEVFGETIPDETRLISPEGKMGNVVLTLRGITKGKGWPETNFFLTNKGGRFVPHVQVVRAGAEIVLVNEDPVFHQVHAYLDDRTVFNLALPLPGHKIKRALRKAGIVEIVCDAHQWMSGWIVVQDHPYFAITDKEGNYAISAIPPGSYTLVAWHEKLGTKQKEVTLSPSQEIKVVFEYTP